MNEERLRRYNATINHISDTISECNNSDDLDWCKEYGCEHYEICKELKERGIQPMTREEAE